MDDRGSKRTERGDGRATGEYLQLLREQIETAKKAAAASQLAAAASQQEAEERRRERIATERHSAILTEVVTRYANQAELIKDLIAAIEENTSTNRTLKERIDTFMDTMGQHVLNATALHEWSEGFQRQVDDIKDILLLLLSEQPDKSRAIKKLKYE